MKEIPQNIMDEYKKLIDSVNKYRYDFHKGKEKISSDALDSLKKRIVDIEKEYPTLRAVNSPSENIESGGKLDGFKKIIHKVAQWSFNDVFSEEEFIDFDKNIRKQFSDVEYFCEYKIDGIKVVLEYNNGLLLTAATRGDGKVGEDVTEHIKTIKDVPQKVSTKDNFVIEGEVWMSKKDFIKINEQEGKKYANPRNLTAGTLRLLNIDVVKSRKLNVFFYDLPYSKYKLKTQKDEFEIMKKLSFQTNPKTKLCKSIGEVVDFWKSLIPHRNDEVYGVDGIVAKVNDIGMQEKLGYTGKAPKFAIAFKFPAEQATSEVEDIAFQIGRTGVITPVAHLRPVTIDGSIVSRATLHNEDNINKLDIRIGDTVIIQKAGDIIPEIVQVLKEMRKGNEKKFIWPKKVFACGRDGSIEREEGKSAWKCISKDSFAQRLRIISHFTSKQAFNIQGFAEKLVEQLLEEGLVTTIDDIFTLKKGDLLELPFIKEKKADNILKGINESRNTTLPRLLIGLSIEGVGQEAAYSLSRSFKDIAELRGASLEVIANVSNIGEERANSIKGWFDDKNNREVLDRLLKQINVSNKVESELSGNVYVITGSFEGLSRSDIERELRNKGATISGTVSKSTNEIFVGEKPGSNFEKAKELGIKISGEKEIRELLGDN